MIEIKENIPKIEPEKKVEKAKVPFHLNDSVEADWIKAKIKSNKEYLSKCNSKSLYQKVEKDTLFLENNILPIIQAKTNLFFNEITKKFVNYFDAAIQNGCNSLAMYIPINDQYIDNPKVAIANCRQNKKFGSMGAVDIYLEIINMDGNEAPFNSILLDKF